MSTKDMSIEQLRGDNQKLLAAAETLRQELTQAKAENARLVNENERLKSGKTSSD